MTTETKSVRPAMWTRGGWRRGLQAGGLGLGLLAAIVVVPGCFADSGGGPPPVCDDGAIQVSWDLSENGQTVECVQGDEVDVTVDSMVKTFACEDHVDTTPLITGGVVHSISLSLYDAGGNLLSSTPVMSLSVGCGQTKIAPIVDFSLTN
jgi:hypothetical protein